MSKIWQTADPTTYEGYKQMIDEYGLEASGLNYGKFCSVTKPYCFFPGNEPKESRLNVKSSFNGVSWSHQLNITRKNFSRFKVIISKEMKSKRFQDEVLSTFNCVELELVLLPKMEVLTQVYKRDVSNRDNWYWDRYGEYLFPIRNWFCKEFKEDWKKLDAHGEKLMNEGKLRGYYIKPVFRNKHFTSEEYDELKTLDVKSSYKNKGGVVTKVSNLMLGQARRLSNWSDSSNANWKEVTLKSTGRTLFYDYSCGPFSFVYIEVDPVIQKPYKCLTTTVPTVA